MAQLINDLTQIISADTTCTTSANTSAAVNIDTREALSGMVHLKFKTSTAGASNTFKVYAQYSPDGTTWDDINNNLCREVATITCPNDTTDHIASIPLTADVVAGNYMRLYFYTTIASNALVVRDAKVAIRRPN